MSASASTSIISQAVGSAGNSDIHRANKASWGYAVMLQSNSKAPDRHVPVNLMETFHLVSE